MLDLGARLSSIRVDKAVVYTHSQTPTHTEKTIHHKSELFSSVQHMHRHSKLKIINCL